MAQASEYERVRMERSTRGFSCEVWSAPPGRVWNDLVHESDELLKLAEGDIELSLGGRTLRPAVGEKILIPAWTPHTVGNIGRSSNRWYYGYRQR